jgi:hypothetical protein
MFRSLALLLTLTLSLTQTQGSVTDCNASSIFRPTKLGLEPPVPVVGEVVKMIVEFENPGPEVNSGKVTTTVTLNFIPFTPSVEPLCQNTLCPIVVGHNDRSTSSTWPSGISGNLVTTSVWNSDDGDNLLCIKTSVKVGRSPSSSYSSSHHLRSLHQPIQNLPSLFRDDLSKKVLVTKEETFIYLICDDEGDENGNETDICSC